MWRLMLCLAACRALTVNEVVTGETPAYPELRSLHQPLPAGRMMARARVVAEAMPGWSACALDTPRRLRCAARGPLGRPAWVELEVEPAGPAASRLRTRVVVEGLPGDLGFGAEQVRAFQAAFLAPTPG